MKNIEWDENKNRANLEKHGLSFDKAELVFQGETLTRIDGRYDYNEVRYITYGKLENRLVVIIHANRNAVIRIISMRKANEREQRNYQDRFEKHVETTRCNER